MPLWQRAATKAAIIDKLDSLAIAAAVLETAGGLRPLGTGAICYRDNGDLGFQPVERAARTLLERQGAGRVTTQTRGDDYGFKWLVARHGPDVYPSLVSGLHAASKAFADGGFGAQLLCAVTFFQRDETTPVALIYLYRRGTFYPFAPEAEHMRDNRLELAVKNALDGRVPIEPDLKRWFPVWDVPGL
ncbi:MAG: PspA-associated protein PspAB [Trebonia sp.]